MNGATARRLRKEAGVVGREREYSFYRPPAYFNISLPWQVPRYVKVRKGEPMWHAAGTPRAIYKELKREHRV